MTIDVGDMARVLGAFQAIPREVDRSTFDVKARAAKLGADPASAFAFVRDEIDTEIYPGVLRGAEGTLQARRGNDLDKTVLLASLLAERGATVRFAHCTLSLEQARQQVAQMFKQRRRESDQDVRALLKASLLRRGSSETRADEIVNAADGVRRSLDTAVIATAQADLATVREALARANLAPLPGLTDSKVEEQAREHYWLQVQGGGRWTDLDVSGDNPSGAAPCAATETYGELPDAVYQTITLRIRNEYIDGQALRSEEVLAQKFRASALYGETLTFVNVAIVEPSAFLTKSKIERFTPFLQTHVEIIAGTEFAATPSQASGAAAVFDAFGGGDAEPPTLGAQWIELLLEAPGHRVLVKRALTDLVDPAERARGSITTVPPPDAVIQALAQTSAIAISAGPIAPVAALETAYGGLDVQAAARAFESVGRTGVPSDSTLEARAAVQDDLLAAYALGYAVVSERALDTTAAAVGSHVRLIRAQPAVTIVNTAARAIAGGPQSVGELSVDFRYNRVSVIVESSAYERDGFWANVLHGLVDGAIEHHLPSATSQPGKSGSPPVQFDATGAFAVAQSQAISTVTARGDAARQFLSGSVADTGGHRLAEEIDNDTALVAPERALQLGGEKRFALWTVNLRTGELLALLDTGLRGQNTVEGKLVRLINFLENQVRRCVASGRARQVCRAMFEMWAQAANELRLARGLDIFIEMEHGYFTGFTF